MLDKMMDAQCQSKKMIQFKFQLHTFYDMRTIHKVTSGELLTKQTTRKKQKNTYMLKLLLDVVTAGIEALVSGNKFLYACGKVCHL
jgi:hypothetical protein